MGKMKVFEVKNLINEKNQGNIESKDIQKFLEKSMGIKKTHSSNLDQHEIKAVKEHFVPKLKKTSGAPATKKVPTANRKSEMGKELTAGDKSITPEKTTRPEAGRQAKARQEGVQSRPQSATRGGNQGVTPRGGAPRNQDPRGQGRPQGATPRGQSQRPSGQGYTSGGQRPVGQGMPRQDGPQGRPQGGPQGRPQGGPQGRPQGGPQGRPQGGPQGRPQGGPQGRPQGGPQGRPQGGPQGGTSRGQAYPRGGQRPAGQGYQGQGYQGQNRRPQDGNRPDYQQRPQGQAGRPQQQGGGYQSSQQQQGQRPSGNRQGGYAGNTGNRQGGYAGNAGNRQGGYNSGTGARPSSNQGNYRRPSGNQDYNKDGDNRPSYENRNQGNRRGPQTHRPDDRKTFDQQILDKKVTEKNDSNNKRNRDRINRDKQYRNRNTMHHDKTKANENLAPKKGQFIKPKPVVVKKEDIKVITLPEVLTIRILADKMKINGSQLIKKLFLAGKVVTINQDITYEEAEEIALEYDIISEKEIIVNEVEELLKEEEEDPATLVKRPPVVCVMGHVDHGKTSLLDAIRQENVTSKEAGGITQHIGAYMAEVKGEKITFLDTPGHEAFTSMRMRGAKATDIAILVVAADDGVMPQTVEAINHAKAAGVQIIVAINKIDKPSSNVERIKQELTEHELVAEDWGGDTIFVPVSAHTKEGIPQLLEMILLTAEMEELKANPDRAARGIVIEAELDKGRGPVATIIVQKGSLRVGDNVAVGSSHGKVRAMIDDKSDRVELAAPSTPVEILGLNSVPDVGEIFMVTENDKQARNIADAFITQGKERLIADTKAKLSLDGLFSQIQAGNIKELNLIIKADVQGSVEAMRQSLHKLSNDEVAVRVIHGGVGAINESDVILASTSNGIIIGFNVKPDNRAKEIADYENVDIKLYSVIYNAINDVEAAMKGLLDPIYEEKVIGHAEIRQIFKSSGIGTIAGSYVLDGKITRGCMVRIYRGKELIHEGKLASLKRFQDDVREVATGYECGLVFEKFNAVKEEDKVELYVMVEVPR